MNDAKRIADALAEPFAPEDVGWLPKTVSGNRALAVAYINARAVMDRLDDVLGIHGWQEESHPLDNGNALCVLRLKIGEEWIPRSDVGGASEQKDAGDRLKAAFSDALKRAAVKWGIGRYLYSLPKQWCDYDQQKKCFTNAPKLPDWALPAPRISRAQALEIVNLVRQHGINPEDLLAYYHIPKLAELPLCHFEDAKAYCVRLGNGVVKA